MKARKGIVLIRTLIGLTTACCGALGYAGYSTVSHSPDTYVVISRDVVQTNACQEMMSSSADSLPLLDIWSNAECSPALQGNSLLIPFPQTLPVIKTICEGSMAASSPMQSFSVEAQFAFTTNPEAMQNSPTYETDELSIWAGQPELGYSSDVEWGIVARIYDGNVYMFLQIGDGNRTLKFQQVPLHKVDSEFHTYSCKLSSTGMGDVATITLECIMDANPPVFITITSAGVSIPSSYGLVAKSMRVSPEATSIAASLIVTKLEYTQ